MPKALLVNLFACGMGATILACATPSHRAAVRLPPSADAVAMTYLGVAGWQVTHGGSVLLVDPYFTRAAVTDGSRPLLPDDGAIARFAPARADVIVVGHSHYDHLLDVPSIAQQTSATVVGTASTLNVSRAAGVPEARLALAVPDRVLTLHGFSIRPLASRHSLIGIDSTDIPRDVHLPLAAKDYGEGGTLAYLVEVGGRSLVFFDTANFDETALRGRDLHPDVAVIATGLREKIPDYTCRLMRLLGSPPLVFPTHFDSHSQPLTGKELRLSDAQRADLAKFEQEVHVCSPATRVVIPEAFRPNPM